MFEQLFGTQNKGYVKISPAQAKERLATEKDIFLVDVRSLGEYVSGHIPGSKLITLNFLGTQAPEQIKDKDAKIFVYCQSGGRSAMAAKTLAGMGYTNVHDLGGIMMWPFEVEKGNPKK